ncbi:response regulator [Larkinella harenae]
MTAHFVILVAEDDEDDRYLLTQTFGCHQPECEVRFFYHGQDLLDELSSVSDKDLPSLILLDLNMPILDGLATLQQIKSNRRLRSIPVLMLTTSDHPDDIQRCYDAGANAYMLKPAGINALKDLADRIIAYWVQSVKLPSKA